MILIYKERPSYAYTTIVCGLGVAALTASLINSSVPLWDARFHLIAFCALTAGTLLYVKVPRASAVVPLSSVFVLAAAVLYGTGAAVTLAAAVALVSSLRLSRGGRSLLCDSALAAAVTFCSVGALLWLDGVAAFDSAFFTAFAVVAYSLVQAAAESVPVSVYGPGAGGSFSPRLYLRALGWGTLVYLIPSSFVVLAARIPNGNALDASLALAAAGAAAYSLYRVYRSNVSEGQPRGVEASPSDAAAVTDARALYSVFNYAAIGMAILSSKCKLLRVNRSMCNFLGYTESELMCSSLQAITQQEDLAPALAGLKSVLKRHSDFLQIEVRHKRRGGERVWALWNVAHFQDPESE
ncbi:MAG TPA: PAS domain S-box protein, partial [Pyrinomonadaceae bacterium]|nr:PAS domain S-box protein [Pyrinomonadaceae bacterium]